MTKLINARGRRAREPASFKSGREVIPIESKKSTGMCPAWAGASSLPSNFGQFRHKPGHKLKLIRDWRNSLLLDLRSLSTHRVTCTASYVAALHSPAARVSRS